MHLTFLQLVSHFPCKIRMPGIDWSDKVDQEMSAIFFSSGITLPQQEEPFSLAVGKSSGSGNLSLAVNEMLYLERMPSITSLSWTVSNLVNLLNQ
nr:hypothetical protein [Tanacetum cinerariifolium]